MALTITLYSFAKRKNSTKRPDGLTGEALQVVLKHPTSYISPAFLIQRAGGFPFNYVVWGDWYYFIDDIISTGNERFEVRCTIDSLATYKTAILATNAFVLYDTAPNSEVVDKRLSLKTSASTRTATATLPIFEVGSVILLGIVGKNTAGIYALTPSEIAGLYSSLGQYFADLMPDTDEPSWDPDPDDLSTILQNVGEAIVNAGDAAVKCLRQLVSSGKASDCIKSALLIPVSPSDFNGSASRIFLGEYDTGVSGKLISQTARAFASASVSIPWPTSDWRRNAPYTHVYLSLPYLGIVQIPSSEIMDADSLTVNASVSVNGTVVYTVAKGSTLAEVGRYTANCANNYMIGASNISPLSQVQALGGVIGGAAAAVAAPALSAAAGIAGLMGTMNAVQPIPSCIGGGGGIAHTSSGVVVCYTVFHDTNVTPDSVAAVVGTPAMESKSLSQLTGYVQTLAASVSIDGEESVRNEINTLLDGGIFIE